MPGKLVHYEIPVDDSAEGREFWSSLFGWQFQPAFADVDYHVTQIEDGVGAAVSGMAPGARGPIAYFDVDDIDAGAARVKELGGESSEKHPVPGMGWFVVCTDPHGNQFGLWQTDESAPTPEM